MNACCLVLKLRLGFFRHEKNGEEGVTYDEYNKFCRSLPATSYVVQWGDSHVWKVGGKVFCIGGWEKTDQPAFTFKASELNFEILRDDPGFRPAPNGYSNMTLSKTKMNNLDTTLKSLTELFPKG